LWFFALGIAMDILFWQATKICVLKKAILSALFKNYKFGAG